MLGPFPYQYLGRYPDELPAPVCTVIISWGPNSRSIPALIDSGADGTFIPKDVAMSLRLRKTDEVEVSGAAGEDEEQGIYTANLDLEGIRFRNYPVISNSKRKYAIIGRDILNRYSTILNGPHEEFSLV